MFKKKTCNIHVCHTFSENRTSVQISAHFQLYTQYSSQSCLIMGTRVIILKVNNSRMIQSNFGSKGPNSFKELKKKKKVYKWQVMAKDHMIICRVGQVV